MKNNRIHWKDLAPEGVSAKKEALFTGIALAASALWSLTLLRRISEEWETVAPRAAEGKVVALMGWHGIQGTALFGFYFVAIAMVFLAMWHYAKLKKDKPTGSENVHMRAMAMPVLGLILAAGLTLILYFAYRAAFLDYRERVNDLFDAAYKAAHG